MLFAIEYFVEILPTNGEYNTQPQLNICFDHSFFLLTRGHQSFFFSFHCHHSKTFTSVTSTTKIKFIKKLRTEIYSILNSNSSWQQMHKSFSSFVWDFCIHIIIIFELSFIPCDVSKRRWMNMQKSQEEKNCIP